MEGNAPVDVIYGDQTLEISPGDFTLGRKTTMFSNSYHVTGDI